MYHTLKDDDCLCWGLLSEVMPLIQKDDTCKLKRYLRQLPFKKLMRLLVIAEEIQDVWGDNKKTFNKNLQKYIDILREVIVRHV